MRRGKAKIGNEDGVVAVEFAIVASILFLLVFGIIQFGLALSRIESFENAARQGAREAAVAQSTGKTAGIIRNDVVEAAKPYGITGGASGIAIQVNGGPSLTDATKPCEGTTGVSNNQVKVSWTQSIPIDIPFWKNATISHLMQATFRCEPKAT